MFKYLFLIQIDWRIINKQFLYSAFIQDEFQILPKRLTFTLGTKVEHNDYTGFEVQPSARLMFKPTENQTVWAAVSRAVQIAVQAAPANPERTSP